MLNKKVRLFGVLILTVGLAITMTACDGGDPIPDETGFVVEIDEEESILDVNSGDEVTVEAIVQNQGDEEDEQDIVLSIYNEDHEDVIEEDFMKETVELDSGDTDTIKFSFHIGRPYDTTETVEVRSNDDIDTAELIVNTPDEVVEFEDENLEDVVREEIGQPTGDIYTVDVNDIEVLSTTDGNIQSLDGIEHLISLESLYIGTTDIALMDERPTENENTISDLEPLTELTELRNLRISNSPELNDISPLKELENLERLFLYHNPNINEFETIAELIELQLLNLGNTGLSDGDLNYISSLEKLDSLWVWNNNITDINFLENLAELVELNLAHNEIDDYSPLSNLDSLEYLNLGNTRVSDDDLDEYIANMTYLEQLFIWDNDLEDISSLENLTKLELFSFHINKIEKIDVVSEMENLDVLNMPENEIQDISPVEELDELTSLAFYDNQVDDISPLKENESWQEGDVIRMYNNEFDPDEESARNVIDYLEDKGVEVYYEEDQLD